MLKAFLSFLALTVVLVTVSFAGLALTGMSGAETMNHSQITTSHAMDCHGADCLTQSSSTADATCLNHCLSSAANQTSAVTPLSLSLIALVLFVLLLTFLQLLTTDYQLPTSYWHSCYGTLLRHRHLATILIRD